MVRDSGRRRWRDSSITPEPQADVENEEKGGLVDMTQISPKAMQTHSNRERMADSDIVGATEEIKQGKPKTQRRENKQ